MTLRRCCALAEDVQGDGEDDYFDVMEHLSDGEQPIDNTSIMS